MDADTETFELEGNTFAIVARFKAQRYPVALAIVISVKGSTSARPGAKAIFNSQGGIMNGWVGGGCAESTVAHAAIECLQTGRAQIVDLDLDDEVLGTGMPCGGSMKVYVEPLLPAPILWILGHGRLAECICRLGALVGLDVVIDDSMADRKRFPEALRILSQDDADYEALQPRTDDYVVVATQHKGDHQSMRRALTSDVHYVALVASRKRTRLVLEFLRSAGLDRAVIDRVRAPAGIDLGAQTPEEVALSVVSEIVLLRRRGSEALDTLRSLGRGNVADP